MKEYLEIAIAAAKEGGNILTKHWGKLSHITEKDFPGDLVTEADKESETQIINFLEERCPDIEILSEEAGLNSSGSSDYQWVVDPLDGTTNYSHQFPVAAVSIGLLYKGKSVVGVVFNPMQNELFQAAKGLGARLNGEIIGVSKANTISSSLLVTGFAYNRAETQDNNYAEFIHMTQITQGVRRLGSAALDLCYVAAGRIDGYWELGLKPWDIAAGIIILEEAGGIVSDYNLGPQDIASGRILATNGLIHHELSRELLKVRHEKGFKIF